MRGRLVNLRVERKGSPGIGDARLSRPLVQNTWRQQTIAFGEMAREAASPFMNEIFPDSDLPYLSEIVAAIEGLFEIVALRNYRIHYAITTECWARNLSRNRAAAVHESGEAHVERMLRYFKLVAMGFRMGKQQLLRLALRPINRRWSVRGSEYWAPPGEWPCT